MAEIANVPDAGRRQGKSPAAFRTISEVAGVLDVPPHVLRFWESKFTQVRPLKRGGGRRYYRPEDVDLLRSIRDLLYTDGYTIKGVQKLLREGGLKAAAPGGAEAAVAAPPPVESSIAVAAPGGRQADGVDPKIRNEIRTILTELESLHDVLQKSL